MQSSNADGLLAARGSERKRRPPVEFLKIFPIVDLGLIQNKRVALIGNFPRPTGIFIRRRIDRLFGFCRYILFTTAAANGPGAQSRKQEEASAAFSCWFTLRNSRRRKQM